MKKVAKLIVCVILITLSLCCLVSCGKSYTVTFVSGEETVATAKVDEKGLVYPAYVETSEGVRLVGWYENESAAKAFDFSQPIMKNITLYARYTSLVYKVTYDLGGSEEGTAPTQNGVNANGTFTVTSTLPQRLGYEFLGWSDGDGMYMPGEVYTVDGATNVVMTAIWEYKIFKVTFIGESGVVAVADVPYGGNAYLDPNVAVHSLECFEFAGWDGSCLEIKEDTELKAIYDYIPTDDSWFEYIEVKDEAQNVTGYTVGMATGEYGMPKSYNINKIFALPAEHKGLPVIGFSGQGISELGMGMTEDFQPLEIDVFIPDSFRKIDANQISAWYVDTVYVGSGLREIDDYAFNGSLIENWQVSEANGYFSASSDGDHLLSKDGSVLYATNTDREEIIIPESVKIINPKLAFNCPIVSVVIEGFVETIKPGAFARCMMMTSFVIKGGVAKLEDGDDCASASSNGFHKNGVFSDCVNLTEISLPGIEYIGFGAFTNNMNLATLRLDNSLEKISKEAFVFMESLAEVKFFTGTSSTNGKILIQNNYIIEKGTSDIFLTGDESGDTFVLYAAKNEVDTFQVPETVRSFYPFAFEFAQINTVVIPEGVEIVSAGLFSGSKLKNITIPASVTTLDNGDSSKGSFEMLGGDTPAFMDCPLETLTFAPNSQLTEIPARAFANTRLTQVELPERLERLGDNAFLCDTIESVSISPQNENFATEDGVLYNKAKTELIFVPCAKQGEYIAPLSLRKVLYAAFSLCVALDKVTLNEGLTEIADLAFSGAKIKQLILPSTLEKVDILSFFDCSDLTYIEMNFSTPPVVADVTGYGEFLTPGLFAGVSNRSALKFGVKESDYDVLFSWLEEKSDGMGIYIDTSDYEQATTYNFVDGNETTTIKARVLVSYPVPIWTGEGEKFFWGWFTENGQEEWGTEIEIPAKNPYDETVIFYARWETVKRSDGTAFYPYEIETGVPLSVNVLLGTSLHFVSKVTNPGIVYNYSIFRIMVDGVVVDSIMLEPSQFPTDGVFEFTINFENLSYLWPNGFPESAEVSVSFAVY